MDKQWAVLVNDEAKAVLCDIRMDILREEDWYSLVRPYHLWQSPEVLNGGPTTPKSDIWSWACVVLDVRLIYRLLHLT